MMWRKIWQLAYNLQNKWSKLYFMKHLHFGGDIEIGLRSCIFSDIMNFRLHQAVGCLEAKSGMDSQRLENLIGVLVTSLQARYTKGQSSYSAATDNAATTGTTQNNYSDRQPQQQQQQQQHQHQPQLPGYQQHFGSYAQYSYV